MSPIFKRHRIGFFFFFLESFFLLWQCTFFSVGEAIFLVFNGPKFINNKLQDPRDFDYCTIGTVPKQDNPTTVSMKAKIIVQ